MDIVFMGTPDFAEKSLQALLEQGFSVKAVYTQTDKPVGRKRVLTPPPVKVLAQRHGIPVYQPKSLRRPEVQEELRALAPDLIVVVAYGKILPREVIDLPPLGCVNVHGSLLPRYRGAAPIQWAVINGEKETGVTTMYMDEGVDTGDIILQSTTPIGPEETAGELFDRLAAQGAELLVETLRLVERGEAPRRAQEGESCYASMLDKELAELDFTAPAQAVHDRVRGLNPWPVAYTFFGGKKCKVFSCEVVPGPFAAPPGCAVADGSLCIACGDGSGVRLKEVLLEGGKRTTEADFLRGHPVKAGDRFAG